MRDHPPVGLSAHPLARGRSVAGAPQAWADRLPLFCGMDLAERIERAEAELVAEASEAARGGTAGAGAGRLTAR